MDLGLRGKVALGTVGTVRPGSGMPHYYASKAALPTLCVSLAKELSGSGITVNLVSPGLIATAEVQEQLARSTADAGGRWANKLLDNPIGRMAEIEEVASLVAYLAGERSVAINGANLRMEKQRKLAAVASTARADA